MRYTVQFDFPARIMRLFDPAAYTPPAGATTIPFELQEDLPIVHVSIDAGTGPLDARLMVDTGASTFIDLNRPFVEKHKLVEAMPDASASERPAALGGTAPFLYGTGRRASLGGIAFDRPRLGLSRATSGSSSRSERDGIIGNAMLEAFVMTVDYRRRVRRPRAAARPLGRPTGSGSTRAASRARIRPCHTSAATLAIASSTLRSMTRSPRGIPHPKP